MLIAICDDNKSERAALRKMADKFFGDIGCTAEITEYADGASFLESPERKDTKLAFLDIYMPGISGIETAREIRKFDDEMIIVLTTTSLEHALDGYSVDALSYLVKPVEYSEVQKVLNRCMKRFGDSMRFIEVLSNRITTRLLLKDIRFIEVLRNLCLIHTTTKTIKCYCPLEEIERQLSSSTFLRTHRSFIVNMYYIEDMAENDFVIKGGDLIPIRRNDKLKIKQTYMDYLLFLLRGGV